MNAGRRTLPDLQSPRIDRIISTEVYPTRDERTHLAAVGARRKRLVSSVVPNSQSQDSIGDVIQGQGEGCLDGGWLVPELQCNKRGSREHSSPCSSLPAAGRSGGEFCSCLGTKE
ncbi:predicted protein [Histoplasma capsulatum var. duboisii H88]|uniref:Predicted protein n=2 Tax=Ajellomyces capsulatus TaxID=5037 RepID=F0UPD1_AJEC8|nr:predicted protein [Histoplasma capsulatum H143]EGC46937.1 predicted protein [Histoplasma capsulatum var. duboisii H88]